MESWLIYGLGAALCFGINGIINKVLTSPSYIGLSSASTAFLFLIGTAIAVGGYVFTQKTYAVPGNNLAILLGILAGFIWAFGFILTLVALNAEKADIARLAPIYNMNTLVIVFLGILLLHELPMSGDMLKVVAGSILIVIGGILVS